MSHIDTTATRILRREALEHADFARAAICELALEGTIDVAAHIQLSERDAARIGSMSRADAIRECERVIAEARASK